MLSAVLVSTIVSEPDVVSCARSDERWCYIGIVADKGVRAIEKSMLEKHWRFCGRNLLTNDSWNTHKSKNVTILSGDLVSFNLEVVFLADFHEREIAIGVGTGLHSGG